MSDFESKVVIITGGGSGIGLAAARSFAAKGARVIITGRRAEALDEVSTENPGITGYMADARDHSSAAAVVAKAVALWGRLDVLVNNAGDGAVGPMEEMTADRIANIFSVNVIYPGMMAAAALPHLEKSHGLIVNISSTYGSKAGAPVHGELLLRRLRAVGIGRDSEISNGTG